MKKLAVLLLFLFARPLFAAPDTHELTLVLGRWNTIYITGASQILYRSPELSFLPVRISGGVAGYGTVYFISGSVFEIWACGEYSLYRDDVWRVYAGAGGIFFQSFLLKTTSFQPVLLAGVSAEIGFFNPEAALRLRFYSDGWTVSLIQDYRFSLNEWLFLTIHPRLELYGYYDFRYAELRADVFAGAGVKF